MLLGEVLPSNDGARPFTIELQQRTLGVVSCPRVSNADREHTYSEPWDGKSASPQQAERIASNAIALFPHSEHEGEAADQQQSVCVEKLTVVRAAPGFIYTGSNAQLRTIDVTFALQRQRESIVRIQPRNAAHSQASGATALHVKVS